MKFVMIAELLLILFSNGIRFYAVKRYIDFFAAREKCRDYEKKSVNKILL